MQIVIDIPQEVKKDIDGWKGQFITNGYDLIDAIKNGTPLEDIKAEIPILSHWQTDDGQDLLMVADALECIDKHTRK